MRLTGCYLRNVAQMLDHYSQFHPSVLSIQQFLDFGSKDGSERSSFKFLRNELPVRLANIMKEINLLPKQLLCMPSVQLVESWYERSFEELLAFEKVDCSDQILERFCETLLKIRNRHNDVVETMAQGMLEMKETHCIEPTNFECQIQYFLDRFYLSRISIRMLISQHTLVFGQTLPENARQIGSIDPYCNVLRVAEDAYENARFLCEQYYMTAPECNFTCLNPHEKLIKNSMRAVVEKHEDEPSIPKLNLMICKGKEDVTIKLSDEGGGIARSEVDVLFNYMYSTAPRPPSPNSSSNTPLAGYGYGLPLSRLYAKYFNGDLRLNSVEGHGTDATIYLKVFPSDASELLPVYNKTSKNKYDDISVPISDWSDINQTNGLHKGPAKSASHFKRPGNGRNGTNAHT
ncbi:[Pyruvate dehydrogenase (acetyl-transferring)] kinase, mitochondrial [Lamellibrachia satsuma]|nr:[Pyruvate dehydrogenase (acetyl-transferring)] kinase, mitochondrial [Lamellibrachia satsuma]